MKEELLRLADRCEALATKLTAAGFSGFDGGRSSKREFHARLSEAANAFACAAALRASVKEQNNGG